MSTETKPCECGKRMILWRTGVVHLTYPEQYPREWRCGCGRREPGPTEYGKTEDQIFMEAWEADQPEEET